MELSDRHHNALIAGLAALAVGTSAFALWSVNRPHPSVTRATSLTASGGSTTDGSRFTDAGSTHPEQLSDRTDHPSEAEGTLNEKPPEHDSPTGEGATVQDWVDAWSDEADLLVIGDGYSNMPNDWVQLWGAELGSDRPVTIYHWGEAEDVSFNDPIVLSKEDGLPLTIWSASRDGTTIGDAVARVDRFVEEAGEVDAVLISLGLDSVGEDVAASLDELITKVDRIAEKAPVLLTVAPPELYEPGVADEIAAWAEENADRFVAVEVGPAAPANPTAEEWALAFDQVISTG